MNYSKWHVRLDAKPICSVQEAMETAIDGLLSNLKKLHQINTFLIFYVEDTTTKEDFKVAVRYSEESFLKLFVHLPTTTQVFLSNYTDKFTLEVKRENTGLSVLEHSKYVELKH